MMKPTIHRNGTAQLDLIEQAENVYRAASVLLDALSKASPNGRDYYPQGDNATQAAIAEHSTRCLAVQKIRKEMLALADHAYEKG